MARSTAQPLQFSMAVQQTFDIQNSETNSHAQPLQFTPGTPYQNFDITPSRKLPTDE
jgi:hypothetical protein